MLRTLAIAMIVLQIPHSHTHLACSVCHNIYIYNTTLANLVTCKSSKHTHECSYVIILYIVCQPKTQIKDQRVAFSRITRQCHMSLHHTCLVCEERACVQRFYTQTRRVACVRAKVLSFVSMKRLYYQHYLLVSILALMCGTDWRLRCGIHTMHQFEVIGDWSFVTAEIIGD